MIHYLGMLVNLSSNYSNTSIYYVYGEDKLFIRLNIKFLGSKSFQISFKGSDTGLQSECQ